MNEIKIIENFLNTQQGGMLTIEQDGRKLTKPDAVKFRYAFSLAEIEQQYGSVTALVEALPGKGFTDGTKALLRTGYDYGTRQTYKLIDTLTLTFPNTMPPTMSHSVPAAALPSAPAFMGNPTAFGLGFTPVATNEWLSTKVKEERYEELLRSLRKTEDELADTRSKLRIRDEELHSLKLKLDTFEERAELKLERDRLDRKGFLESPGFEKMLEVAGMAMPAIMASVSPAAAVAPALAMPQLSEAKQQFIQFISQPHITEEMIEQLYEQISMNNGN